MQFLDSFYINDQCHDYMHVTITRTDSENLFQLEVTACSHITYTDCFTFYVSYYVKANHKTTKFHGRSNKKQIEKLVVRRISFYFSQFYLGNMLN